MLLTCHHSSDPQDATRSWKPPSAWLMPAPAVQICHRPEYSGVDSSADLELPLMTQNDVECIKAFSQVGASTA